jgi:filamentous hemagglutinin family protein
MLQARCYLFGAVVSVLALAPQSASANPTSGKTVAGSATITGQGTPNVTVTQSSASAIINWNSFNIGAGEITRFLQPSASSYTLNRVTGSQNPSQILGTIEANGRIFLVNPDGFIFGTGAKINTASFLATTHDIRNADFMAGNLNFSIPGNSRASIINQGTITASSGGFAALVAPAVRNDGVIVANLGTVALAGAGKGFTLDLYGDRLIQLYAGDSVPGDVLGSVVSNTGTLRADGGKVLLSAATAQKVVDSVINTSGVIEARSVGLINGMIVFGAQTTDSKTAGAPAQSVKVSGTVDASGKRKGEKGGTVQITGEAISLQSVLIDASGTLGGGKILIGGDWGGGASNAAAVTQYGQSFEPTTVPTAASVTVDAASSLNASATASGKGGKVVVWGNQSTQFDGLVSARGGDNSGDGGFVEVSSHGQLAFSGATDTAAPNGQNGKLLLDPRDVTIGTTGAWVVTPASMRRLWQTAM